MRQIQLQHAQKPSVKIMKKVLGPMVTVLKDYYGIIDTLAQADPTPGIIIWGSLKVVIDGLSRFIDLFDKIKGELMSMTAQLQRLSFYDEIYGDSLLMQELLFSSYKNVFRFWSRVDKECDRCSLNALLRAAASFSTKKLQGILDDLTKDADRIEKLVPIIEGRMAKGAREDAEKERAAAGLERSEHRQERQEASAWRKQSQSDRIRSWLGGYAVNEFNLRRHQNNTDISKVEETCDWLLENNTFKCWTDGSSKPVLWLYAGPGFGKSTLCSRAVNCVENLNGKPAVAFQFYDFNDSQRTALTTARVLGLQLFEHLWLRKQDIPESLSDQTQRSAADLKNVLEFIRLTISELPKVYIFLDGLDEECTIAKWQEASRIVDFLVRLSTDFHDTVRIWISSQDRFFIREKLAAFPTLNIRDDVKVAVDRYLALTVPGLETREVDDKTRDWILTELRNRAQGNFLWASRMIKTIETEVTSFDHLEQFIKEGLPKDLDEYYRRIFCGYEDSEQDLASKIFAIITFARRPLRLKELQSAIGMVSTQKPRALNKSSIPFRQSVERLFAPLIETQQDPEDEDDCFCRLFHATVKDFLVRNAPDFPQGLPGSRLGSCLSISESTIANACLLYLSQDRYAELLTKNGDDWITTSHENTARHHFLTYAAKYWDKHLDDAKEASQLSERIEKFLRSANFQTTIQVQSLCVEGHFSIYTVSVHENEVFTKRVLPKWFSNHSNAGCGQFSKDYQRFISEWDFLLLCATDDAMNEFYYAKPFAGEIDRCLWAALGPLNFLSSNRERHPSFMLDDGVDSRRERTGPYYEAYTVEGNEVRTLQLMTGAEANICFHQEIWRLAGDAPPTLMRSSLISSGLGMDQYLSTYGKSSQDQQRSLGSPTPMSFSPDLEYLRIGSAIFTENANGDYVKIDGLDAIKDYSMADLDGITGRGPYFVITSRRSSARASISKHESQDQKPASQKATEEAVTKDSSEDEGYLSNESSQISSGDSSTDEGSKYGSADESWSEGSTSQDQDGDSICGASDNSSISDDLAEKEENEREYSSDEGMKSYGRLQYSDSDGEGIDFEDWSGDDESEADYNTSGDEQATFERLNMSSDEEGEPVFRGFWETKSGRQRAERRSQRGSIVVCDMSSGHPVELFKYTQHLPVMLYSSPPAIHPSKPLVVWPLCGGDILFADFESKTHFTRQAGPSTPHTRHVFVKVHFSACGHFLHVASLEAQQKPKSKRRQTAEGKGPVSLSIFVSTHRLSTSKTARSPPSLIHRAKVDLGKIKSFSGSKMPVELTWTPKELYISNSSAQNQLSLFRVQLFNPSRKHSSPSSDVVTVPKQPIFLPRSSQHREVRYFHPTIEGPATVLIGSQTKAHVTPQPNEKDTESDQDTAKRLPEALSPPIGFRIDESKDLGGWGLSNAVVKIKPGLGSGELKRKVESFNAQDDCDLEYYFFDQ